MEHRNLSLLLNITLALVWAFAGGLLARRPGFPSLVGHLLAGVAALLLLEGDTVCLLGTKEQLAKADALPARPPAPGENPD